MDESEYPNPMVHILELSKKIGPRRPTTEKEHKAAEYIKSYYQLLGLSPTLEEFKAPSTFSWGYILLFGLFIFAFLLYPVYIIVATCISFIALVIFLIEGSSKISILTKLSRGKSYNVITEISPKNEVKKTIVLSGHYDSSRAAWFFNPKYVSKFRPLFLSMAISGIILPLLYLFAVIVLLGLIPAFTIPILDITALSLTWYISVIPTAFLFIGFISMILRELAYTDVPGANDNASGASIVLSLAKILSKTPLDNTKVIFVSTGSEESGMNGMMNFLKRHGKHLKDAYFINFDNLGIGNLTYVIGEGLLTTLWSDKELVCLAEKVAQAHPEWNVTPKVYKLLPTDAAPVIAQGFKAISIMSFDDKGLLPNWHWYTDVYENVEEKTVMKALKFAYELIKEIDKS